jgi:hypothetical protein
LERHEHPSPDLGTNHHVHSMFQNDTSFDFLPTTFSSLFLKRKHFALGLEPLTLTFQNDKLLYKKTHFSKKMGTPLSLSARA